MGVAGVIALIVIFIGFPLATWGLFKIVLSADDGESDDR